MWTARLVFSMFVAAQKLQHLQLPHTLLPALSVSSFLPA